MSNELQQHHKAGQYHQETKVKYGKPFDIVCCFAGIVLGILAEGDQAGQGGNQGAYAANVDAHQQIRVITGKLGQQDRGRDVADKLAGKDAEQQSASIHQCGKQVSHPIDSRHIAGKNKEKHKGKQQGIIHHFKCFSVHEEQHRGNHHQADPIGDPTEHDGDG